MRIARLSNLAFAALAGQLAMSSPGIAETRAYVLVEIAADGDVQAVLGIFGRLHNCKGIAGSLAPLEVVAAVGCNDVASLNQSMTTEVAAVKGVSRVTTMIIRP